MCAGVGRSSSSPARQRSSAALSPEILPPYPESRFNDAISASASADIVPFPTVIYGTDPCGAENSESVDSSSCRRLEDDSPEGGLPLYG